MKTILHTNEIIRAFAIIMAAGATFLNAQAQCNIYMKTNLQTQRC